MAARAIIVSNEVRLQLPPGAEAARAAREQGVEVVLDEGRRARLDPREEKSPGYAQILAGLERLRQPVYLEVDPDTDEIVLLRIPEVGRTADVRETAEGAEFELDTSHVRFLLSRRSEQFGAFREVLGEAARSGRPLVVTTDDSGREVVDARFFEPGPGEPPLSARSWPRPRPRPPWDWLVRWLRWPLWPWNWWFGCMSAAEAQQLFDAMSATSCDPLAVPPPCIPFLYPDDGCWARAHEMCRLMIAMAISPHKVWIQGTLHTPTRNNPACFVNWGWHVAPTVCVRRFWRWLPWAWSTQRMVIDPSLFTAPVPVAQWKSVQGDPGATLTYTDASDYLWGQTDSNYSLTNYWLDVFRGKLHARSINAGPPPYANCP